MPRRYTDCDNIAFLGIPPQCAQCNQISSRTVPSWVSRLCVGAYNLTLAKKGLLLLSSNSEISNEKKISWYSYVTKMWLLLVDGQSSHVVSVFSEVRQDLSNQVCGSGIGHCLYIWVHGFHVIFAERRFFFFFNVKGAQFCLNIENSQFLLISP
jgi:hypothetical protein